MTNDVLGKLKTPAIGLIVCGALNGVIGVLTLLSGLLRLSGINGREQLPTNSSERFGYFLATFGSYGVALLSLILAPLVIYGAMKMLKGEKRGLAMAAAILPILPFTSCCFVIGAIFGIWAIVILMKPEVKSYFENGGNQNNFYPPQPPKF